MGFDEMGKWEEEVFKSAQLHVQMHTHVYTHTHTLECWVDGYFAVLFFLLE